MKIKKTLCAILTTAMMVAMTTSSHAVLDFYATRHLGIGVIPGALATADLNGDHLPDLVVAGEGFNVYYYCVTVLLNKGNGSFAKAVKYTVTGLPTSVAIGDINGDHVPDIVAAHPAKDNISVMMGNGNGTFKAAVYYNAGDQPVSVALADLNRDGYTDLAVSNASLDCVSVLLNNGDGTFTGRIGYSAGDHPTSLFIEDLDGNGLLDLVTADYNYGGPGSVSVLMGNGDGTFAAPVHYSPGVYPGAVTAADLNGDGHPDLAVKAGSIANSLFVSVMMNNGDGTFAAAVQYNFGKGWSATSSLIPGDFNGDHHLDLAVANYGGDCVFVLINNGDGTFAAPREYNTGYLPNYLVAADFDSDNIMDLAVADSEEDNDPGEVAVLFGNGDGTFRSTQRYSLSGNPETVVSGDLDGDNALDLVITSDREDEIKVSVLMAYGDGTFAPAIDYKFVGPSYDVSGAAIGDINGDNDLDLVLTVNSSLWTLMGNGDGTFGAPVFYGIGQTTTAIAINDLNGDNLPDVAVARSGGVSVLLNKGSGKFYAPVTYNNNNYPSSIATGDLNTDNHPDLVLGNYNAFSLVKFVSVLLNNGNGTFSAPVNYNVIGGVRSVAVGDLNNDNAPDIVAACDSDSDAVEVLLNNGDGTFPTNGSTSHWFTVGNRPWSVAIADLDGDGIPDLAVANYYSNDVAVLPGKGNGTFAAPLSFCVGRAPVWVTVADLNNDNRPDLATADSASKKVSVLINRTAPLEICDGIDNDLDDLVDEGCRTCYRDGDADGYGDPAVSIIAIGQPAGYVFDNTDSDDTDPDVNPGAAEVCDGIDNDSDGAVDEGCLTWCRDSDSDNYGDRSDSVIAMFQPAGFVSNKTDCDDTNAAIHPGATEVCGNGIDEDCSGADLACGGGGVTVIYVDKDATGANNGTSWANAFVCLQDALFNANAASGAEIWVAAGTHYPDEGSGLTDNDRSYSFIPPSNSKIYGGFDGTDGTGGGALEAYRDQRDPENNVTVLSGDLAQNDIGFTNNGENAYRVVSMISPTVNFLLDGFTITAGNGSGGIYLDSNGNQTVQKINNCIITMNYASVDGGGIYISSFASPILTNCRFTGNTAGAKGGAMYVGDNLAITVSCNLVLTNCCFRGNTANEGGAIYNDGSMSAGEIKPVVTNCVFSGNKAVKGGAIYNYSFSYCEVSPVLTNCTFSGNNATSLGKEIYNYFAYMIFGPIQKNPPQMANCIVWNDSPIYNYSSKATYTYCDIKGSGGSASWNTALGTDLGGNIDADPLLVDPPVAANAPTTAGDVHLQDGSPCIDTGTVTGAPATDMDGNARDAAPDIGADEYLPDTDGDGEPDITDGCPTDPDKTAPGQCGCGVPNTDSDSDGTANCIDACPTDPDKTVPGACGCGVADVDTDNDGVLDCADGCPNDAAKIAPGACGCGMADADTDNDGVLDCSDGCPSDSLKTAPGACGCGVSDMDSDGDGSANCNDGCPNDPKKMSAGACGCGTPDIDANGNGIMDCLDQPPGGDMEACDGIDNDYDGTVDEGCTAWFRDSDGDGYGDPAVSMVSATQPAGYVNNQTDCDDANAAIHSNAAEICGNGIDEDCSGADLACGGGGTNLPPVADAGEDRGVAQGTAVNLDGSDSYDPDDGIADYLWTQTAGPTMVLSDPAAVQPTFTVPADALGAALTFQLTVTDRSGVTDTDSVTLTIVDQACNTRPDKPVLVSPANGATGVSLTPTLQSGPYSDPGDCSTHFKTRWQISDQADFSGLTYNANTFYDELTAHQVTKKVLKPGITYYWRVKFWGDHGVKSEWSEVFTFTTASEPADNNGNGVQDGQEPGTDTDVNENGIPDSQEADLRVLLTADGNAIIGLGFADDIQSIAVETMGEEEIFDTENMPENFPYGLIAFRVMLANPGATVSFTVYLQDAAPADAAWYKYDTVNGWYDFTGQVVFSPNRKSLTFTLTDGGTGDADGVVNGVIVDPAGLAAEAEDGSSNGHGGGSSSCFIDTSAH